MRVSKGSAWVGLGLLGLGCGGGLEAPDVPAGLEVEDSRPVEAQACPAGVASRVKVVLPPEAPAFATLDGLTNAQGTLYFATNNPDATPTLWRSNGTPAGTVPVRTFPAGDADLQNLAAVGSRVFFQLQEPATGSELWVSDGTSGGTRLVKDITPGPNPSWLLNFTELNGRLVFFRQPTDSPAELWRSDGTESGTLRVRVVSGTEGLLYDRTAKVNNALLFFRKESSGLVLWRTDGMLANTSAVKQVGGPSVLLGEVKQEGNLAVFIVQNGPNYQVWKTDGTAGGTQLLDAFGRYVRVLGVLGSRVYLASVDPDTQLMRIQSLLLSGGGKASVATLPRYSAETYPYVQNTVTSGGRLYFAVAQGGSGPAPLNVELWNSDGTSTGTRKVFETLSTNDEYASPLFDTGEGIILFSGTRPADYRLEAWFTRGTTATTGRLAPTGPGTPLSRMDGLVRMGSRVYFSVFDDTGRRQLWSVPASFSCPAGFDEARE
jgi:ELWxxDGT repeat protein